MTLLAIFGGMSGVILAYWPFCGGVDVIPLILCICHPQLVGLLMVFWVVGLLGGLGNVANLAYLAGLFAGNSGITQFWVQKTIYLGKIGRIE